MFSKSFHFVILSAIFVLLQGAACFFVKHVQTGMCINDTSVIQADEPWGNLSFVELSNNCLDPAAQFRFLANSAMFNLKRKGCFEGTLRWGSGYKLPMLYLLLSTVISANCRDKEHAITQTPWGGLSVYYMPDTGTRCAEPGKDNRLATNVGIDPYIGLTTNCNNAENKRFNFGSVTCYGNKVENANCPKDQYMVVKIASYRGLSATTTCGLSDDYSCEVNVTCLVKKQCDGQHECSITVDDNLFSGDLCSGLTKYLCFEYQCNDIATSFNELCVDAVYLSYSSLPNEGFVKFTTDSGIKNVCWQSLGNAKDVVCRELGYKEADSHVEKPAPSNFQDEIFSGSIICSDGDKKLSQCSVTTSSRSCSKFSYLECHICPGPLLGDNNQRFPNTTFTASVSSEGRSPPDARISSASSWCAPVSHEKDYLQVNLRRLHVIYNLVTFGDSTRPNWVATYNLTYTIDSKNWRSVSPTIFQGNKNAYNDAAIQDFPEGITTRALRFIPLTYVGQPCMRIEICGATLLPDQPLNLKVTDIKSRSAEISWLDSANTGDGNLTGVRIKLKKENSLILNTTTDKVNKYKLDKLTPYTTYEISVAVRNKHGFGEETITSFTTSEEAPNGPPLNVKVTAESSTSLFVTWEPPENDKRNGMIVNYTVCISHEECKPCFEKHTTKENMLIIDNLNVSTKYYVRVLASTKLGFGNYSESKGKFTHGTKDENDDGSEKYLAGIIVLAILLIISFVIIAYFIYQVRRLKSSKANKNKDRNNSEEIDENSDNDDANYEDMGNEESTYTALKRFGPEADENDGHVYAHLTEVHTDYVNQNETGF